MSISFDNNEHLGRLARRPYLGMMKEVYANYEKYGFTDVNAAHSVVFQFIGSGARVTNMARMANTTKQNMKYLVEYLESKGYVYRSEDATDKRALLFRLTEKGQEFREQTYKTINDVERKWTQKLGKEKIKTLKALLSELGNIIIEEHGYL